MTIAIAIIGVSGYADCYYCDLLALARQRKILLVAATIVNQSEEVDKCDTLRSLGCQLFTDHRQMLKKWRNRIALCIIPTGIHLHAEMTIDALEAGANVLVEKPAAGSVGEVDLMRAAETRSNRFVAVGFQLFYTPEIAWLKRAILDGLVGDVACIKSLGLWPRRSAYYQRNNWAGKIVVDGQWVRDSPFNNAFAHWLSLLCFLGGSRFDASVDPCSVEAELYRTRSIESADTACLRVHSDAGFPLALWVGHSCPHEFGPVLEVRGSKGSLILNGEDFRLVSAEGTQIIGQASSLPVGRAAMLETLLEKIRGADPFYCNLDIARAQTLCSELAFASGPIRTISREFLRTVGTGPEEITVIDSIQETTLLAYQQERLWSEMAVHWASTNSASYA